MYNKSIEIVKKLALLCFESFDKAHEHRKHCIFIGHTYHRALLHFEINLYSVLRKRTHGCMVHVPRAQTNYYMQIMYPFHVGHEKTFYILNIHNLR
jgi:hypothetical protein